MREIKFRAWDKENKRMCSTTALFGNPIIYTNNNYYDKEKDCQQCKELSMSDIELMQFTGLKDMNGKEIYEGDITKARYYSGNINTAEIKFKDGCFGPNGFFNWGDICEIEVIGNIYENPKLLKEASK